MKNIPWIAFCGLICLSELLTATSPPNIIFFGAPPKEEVHGLIVERDHFHREEERPLLYDSNKARSETQEQELNTHPHCHENTYTQESSIPQITLE